MDEVKDFHPIVERWLQDHGYDYEHHVELDHGIVDFIATHRDIGEVLCIECKAKNYVSTSDAAQVLLYLRQVPGSKPVLALPTANVSDNSHKICKRFNIRLLSIELTDSDRRSIRVRRDAGNKKKRKTEPTPRAFSYARKPFRRRNVVKARKLSFIRWQSDVKYTRDLDFLRAWLDQIEARKRIEEKRRKFGHWRAW